jgi:hypothetical protein
MLDGTTLAAWPSGFCMPAGVAASIHRRHRSDEAITRARLAARSGSTRE